VKLENFIVVVAKLSKTLHINFYQNRSSIVEVVIKKFGVFFMPHSVFRRMMANRFEFFVVTDRC